MRREVNAMIFAVKPFEIHDGDGIRTTVFFKGCPLRCKWCHNPESFSSRREVLYDAERCVSCLKCTALCAANTCVDGVHTFDRAACTACGACESVCPFGALEPIGRTPTPQALAEELLRDAIFMKSSGGGVTFSGGEPLLQVNYCVELAQILRREGIDLAVDTCAYVPQESIERILPYTGTFLFDVKAISPDVHRACTGVDNEQILANIRFADEQGIPMEIRYPYVPTYNDGEALAVAQFAATLKHLKVLRILPYHGYADRKYACLGMTYPTAALPSPDRFALESLASQMRVYVNTVVG